MPSWPTCTGSGPSSTSAGPGGPRTSDKSYKLLYPLLDLTTTLDPHFNIAYRFGAIFLSEPYPGGPGRTDQAIALLERGLAANPTRWQYAQDAGFVHYWYRQDYKAAAEWFDRAARIEGAPWWLRFDGRHARWQRAETASRRGRCGGSSTRRPTTPGCGTTRS